MSVYSIQPLVLGEVRSYLQAEDSRRVPLRTFVQTCAFNISLTKFLDSLPQILAGRELRQLLTAIHAARKQRKAILWEIGRASCRERRQIVLLRRVKHLS